MSHPTQPVEAGYNPYNAPLTKAQLDNLTGSLDAAMEVNWRYAALEAVERIIANHYCPRMPKGRRHYSESPRIAVPDLNLEHNYAL